MKLVHRLVKMSEVDPGLRILRNEDAALGMWIVGSNVTVEHDNTFWPEPPSMYSPKATLIHRQAVHMLKKLQRGKLSVSGDICSYEFDIHSVHTGRILSNLQSVTRCFVPLSMTETL